MSTAQEAATGDEDFAPRISTVAGTGVAGFKGDDGPAVLAELNYLYGVAVDGNAVLYISDYSNQRVRKVTTEGEIRTVAGTGIKGSGGDGGPAVKAQLNGPREVAVDSMGAIYIADADNHRIRKIAKDGKISTVAGTGTAGFSGDGGPATDARLNCPFGVAVDSTGVLYVADNNNRRIRKIVNQTISTVAGNGTAGSKGDNGQAVSAQLNNPHGVAVDRAGNLYIADADNNRIRKVTVHGEISTVAGTGIKGSGGDGGPAVEAQLDHPVAVVVDSDGALYIAEHSVHRVRKVLDGTISTVAGTGTQADGGDGGPAAEAQLHQPRGLAVDCVDNLYIADRKNNRVRKISSAKMAGLPDSGTVVSWVSVRSRLRMGVLRESTKDGAPIHQALASPRAHQRWRLIVTAQDDDGDVLYRIENVRSGKVLEVVGAGTAEGAVVAQRAYEGAEAHHQQWRLIPVGSGTDTPRVYEIANRHSGLLLRVETNAPSAIKQHGSGSDHRDRQWQLLTV
ncbi:RICIN domain-containing protein [Streptomyces aurantiacus]|uniref:NHL domain-containing protein n=1 Tax=Streptomyces aurantiacus TaxID=47760 RepID=UPI0006E135B5|nr:RICIN domain-containing protein [Streptomyces aurantiacus]